MQCPFCHLEIETYCPKCNKRIDNYCPFCHYKGLKPRIFYDDKVNWIGFLAAPYHTEGHTILAAYPQNCCPNDFKKLLELSDDYWSNYGANLGIAIKTVSKAIMECYRPKNVLFASLRGDIKHFHFHLVPLHEKEEKKWRSETLYEGGHLFEFLGYLEEKGDTEALQKRIQKGWDKKTQREVIVKRLKNEVEKLRNITGYQP
jgi:diadenosine tetraphosphate (Ap4A) HIT family hydrolase